MYFLNFTMSIPVFSLMTVLSISWSYYPLVRTSKEGRKLVSLILTIFSPFKSLFARTYDLIVSSMPKCSLLNKYYKFETRKTNRTIVNTPPVLLPNFS